MKKKGLTPLPQLLNEKGLGGTHYYPTINLYMLDFSRMYTKDLLFLYRNLTLFNGWLRELREPEIDKEREKYLKQLNELFNTNFKIEDEFSEYDKRLHTFFTNRLKYAVALKKILATRENIPNKKQAKKIRRLKAEGRYIID